MGTTDSGGNGRPQSGGNGRPQSYDADVVVIGAGPGGAAAAVRLQQLGVRDVVLVDRAHFPRDKTCGSGLSPKGIQVVRELGVWEAIEPDCYWIRGLRLVTPGDRETLLSGGSDVDAVICSRRIFDNALVERARALGATFLPGFVATELRTAGTGGRVTGVVARDGREIRARHTLVAGGAHCRLGQVGAPRPRRLIHAIMGWWEDVPVRPGYVEMIFDRMVAPYYGWLFPESETRVNIGITYPDSGRAPNARALFQRFLDKHFADRLQDARQVGAWKGHPIAWSLDIGGLTAPGRLTVGEAGNMTHPATGEGIYQAMRSGVMAAEAVVDVHRGRVPEAGAWSRYEQRCRRAFLFSFWAGVAFQQLVRTPLLDWIAAAKEQPLLQTLTGRVMARM